MYTRFRSVISLSVHSEQLREKPRRWGAFHIQLAFPKGAGPPLGQDIRFRTVAGGVGADHILKQQPTEQWRC